MRQLGARPAGAPPPHDRLPAGRHRIPDHEVREHQRARLTEAISALSAERGYANIVIADVVSRAGVSKSTFYRFYRTKEECLFDAHKRHSAELLAAIDRSRNNEPSRGAERLQIGIRAALAYLSDHPQAAHLLTIGILSSGPRGAHRYAVTSEALEARLQGPGAVEPTDSPLLGALLAASTITQAALPRGKVRPPALESELLELFLAIRDRGTDRKMDRISFPARAPGYPDRESRSNSEDQE